MKIEISSQEKTIKVLDSKINIVELYDEIKSMLGNSLKEYSLVQQDTVVNDTLRVPFQRTGGSLDLWTETPKTSPYTIPCSKDIVDVQSLPTIGWDNNVTITTRFDNNNQ